MDISDDGSVCRDANSSDEEEINDHRSQDDSINYEIGEDGDTFDSIIIIILNDIILLSAWIPFLLSIYQPQWVFIDKKEGCKNKISQNIHSLH